MVGDDRRGRGARVVGLLVIVDRAGYSGFREDGAKALEASPDYFLTWYTLKSVALVGAIAWGAYLLGTLDLQKTRRPRFAPDSRL